MTNFRDQLRRLVDGTDAPLTDVLGDLEAVRAAVLAKVIASATTPVAPADARLVGAPRMAELLDLPQHWVRDHARRKLIPSIKTGHYVLFDPAEVIAAVKALNGRNSRMPHPVRAEKRSGGAARVQRVSIDPLRKGASPNYG